VYTFLFHYLESWKKLEKVWRGGFGELVILKAVMISYLYTWEVLSRALLSVSSIDPYLTLSYRSSAAPHPSSADIAKLSD
jgi:hypothetical protein